MVGLPIGLFVIWVCRSVGQTIQPVCYPTSHRLTGHRLTGHLNIHPPALDQPTKDTSSTSGECLNFRYRGSKYPRFRPAGWLQKGCLTHACKPLVMFKEWFIQPLWGYISPRLDRHYPNRLTWEHSLLVCDLVAMSFIRVPIGLFSCHIQLKLLRRHPTRNGFR